MPLIWFLLWNRDFTSQTIRYRHLTSYSERKFPRTSLKQSLFYFYTQTHYNLLFGFWCGGSFLNLSLFSSHSIFPSQKLLSLPCLDYFWNCKYHIFTLPSSISPPFFDQLWYTLSYFFLGCQCYLIFLFTARTLVVSPTGKCGFLKGR